MTVDVFVLGGAQTDFARNYAQGGPRGRPTSWPTPCGTPSLAAAVEASAIETIHVGNAFGQLFNGQGHLGGMPATVEPALWGVLAMRHEAARASGGIAVLAAMAEIEARTLRLAPSCRCRAGAQRPRRLGRPSTSSEPPPGWATRARRPSSCGPTCSTCWPRSTTGGSGSTTAHLHAIAELNLRQRQGQPARPDPRLAYTPESFIERRRGPTWWSTVASGGTDCSQVTDGGAGVVAGRTPHGRGLGSGLRHRPRRRAPHPRLGPSHRRPALRREGGPAPADEEHVLPHVRQAITDALAGLGSRTCRRSTGSRRIDCFTPSEYAAIDHFGITKPGAAWQAIEDGRLERIGDDPGQPLGRAASA